MVQLQDALNELSEEHNAAQTQSQAKQAQLEGELRAVLQEKVRGWGRVSAKSSECPPPPALLHPLSVSAEMPGREGRDPPGEDFPAGRPAGQAGGLQHAGKGRGHGRCPEGTDRLFVMRASSKLFQPWQCPAAQQSCCAPACSSEGTELGAPFRVPAVGLSVPPA